MDVLVGCCLPSKPTTCVPISATGLECAKVVDELIQLRRLKKDDHRVAMIMIRVQEYGWSGQSTPFSHMSSNLLEAYRRISTNWLRYVIFALWYLYMRLDLLHELAESGHSICD